ncbi:hypothetical protein QUB08_09855 [Microcoleus sp. BR0-C5]|uniref:hypothetical protein n=1 Tax=Microcoleus sp. BR0-C5 TaxID=2818713 RepID=UPI002FD187F6
MIYQIPVFRSRYRIKQKVVDVVSALVSGAGGLSIAPITLPTDKKFSRVAQLLSVRSSWGRTRYGKVWHRRCKQK